MAPSLVDQPCGHAGAAGISLGNGWFGSIGGGEPDPNVSRVFRAKLVVDGRSLVTTTGDAWACHPGPIVYDSIYNGEVYDARVEPQVGLGGGEEGRRRHSGPAAGRRSARVWPAQVA